MNLAPLNVVDHAKVRLRAYRPEIPYFVEIVSDEFAAAAAVCPILFAKNPETGAFYVGALFGFKPGENLVGAFEGQISPYIPLDCQRAGFYVSGDEIAIDLENPRFSSSGSESEALFEEGGEPGPALRQIQRLLGQLVRGKQDTDAFIARLLALRLIESMDITLSFDDGEPLVLDGLYTVSLDAIHELGDSDALDLFRNGYLQLIYVMAASLRQIAVLAERRNRMLVGGI